MWGRVDVFAGANLDGHEFSFVAAGALHIAHERAAPSTILRHRRLQLATVCKPTHTRRFVGAAAFTLERRVTMRRVQPTHAWVKRVSRERVSS